MLRVGNIHPILPQSVLASFQAIYSVYAAWTNVNMGVFMQCVHNSGMPSIGALANRPDSGAFVQFCRAADGRMHGSLTHFGQPTGCNSAHANAYRHAASSVCLVSAFRVAPLSEHVDLTPNQPKRSKAQSRYRFHRRQCGCLCLLKKCTFCSSWRVPLAHAPGHPKAESSLEHGDCSSD